MSKIVYCIPASFRKCILFVACEIILKWIRSPQHTWNCFFGDVLRILPRDSSPFSHYFGECVVYFFQTSKEMGKSGLARSGFSLTSTGGPWPCDLLKNKTLSFVLLLFFSGPQHFLSPHPDLNKYTGPTTGLQTKFPVVFCKGFRRRFSNPTSLEVIQFPESLGKEGVLQVMGQKLRREEKLV